MSRRDSGDICRHTSLVPFSSRQVLNTNYSVRAPTCNVRATGMTRVTLKFERVRWGIQCRSFSPSVAAMNGLLTCPDRFHAFSNTDRVKPRSAPHPETDASKQPSLRSGYKRKCVIASTAIVRWSLLQQHLALRDEEGQVEHPSRRFHFLRDQPRWPPGQQPGHRLTFVHQQPYDSWAPCVNDGRVCASAGPRGCVLR
jgi:hypothetical protein